MSTSPLEGSKTSWKRDEKPCRRVWSSGPRTVAPVALMAPVATDLAVRLMSGRKCTSRAKPRSAHESGNSRTNREEVPRRWSYSLQLRPGGWSDSPQGVERIAPPATPLGQPSATRSASSAAGGPSGKTGTGADKGDSSAACGRETPGSAPLVTGPDQPRSRKSLPSPISLSLPPSAGRQLRRRPPGRPRR